MIPLYLVKPSQNENVYGYDNLTLLRVHLAENKDVDAKVWRFNDKALITVYEPFDWREK